MEQRRPAKTDELQSQMVIFDVAQRRDETLRDAPGMAMRLHFKQELLAMLPRSDLNVRYRSCAVVITSSSFEQHPSRLGGSEPVGGQDRRKAKSGRSEGVCGPK
jgi:hypothetical protein